MLPVTTAPPAAVVDASASPSAGWPPALAAALSGHGLPHAKPIALPRDAGGRDCWLAFVGTEDVAMGAWHVTIAADGSARAEPTAHWPTGVRVVASAVHGGVAYVLLESVATLDQPGGLRGVWTDRPSEFDRSPLALANVMDLAELPARMEALPPQATPLEHHTTGLLGTLRAAAASPQALGRALSPRGADMQVVWQSLFARTTGHADAATLQTGDVGGRALSLVRDALGTQACGLDACEAWTDHGHAVVRLAPNESGWTIATLSEDAPAVPATPGQSPPREIEASPAADETRTVLLARAREIKQLLGEAPLTPAGGTIGVALTDAAPDAPTIAVREGAGARLFPLDVGAIRADVAEAAWDAAFADVDGDGRTDVVLRMAGSRSDGSKLSWTQVFLAPPPSVQATAAEADLATALAVMDAPDAKTAAREATALTVRPVSREEACLVLSSATTPAGFRKAAASGARLLQFQQPGRPTWRPKVVLPTKIAAGDVHDLGAHCADLRCDKTRPYCSYTVPGDSLHVWFSWNGARLEILGAADYTGE
jgi:hypothetical protein